MGKLFWKFFFSFWLALVIAGLVVGTTIWLRQMVNDDEHHKIDLHQAALVASAKHVYELYGEPAFIDYLKRGQHLPGPKVYAIDTQTNRDILGRELNEAFITHARQIIEQDENSLKVRKLTLNDQQSVLLFVPDLRHKSFKHHPAKWFGSFLFGHEKPKPPHFMDSEIGNPPEDFTDDHLFQPPKPPEKKQAFGLLWLMLAGFIAAFIFSFLLAWYFTRPINTLRSGLSAMASGKLDTRVSNSLKSRNDELSDLGNSFDEMASKIQQLVTTQQQLLHDVSHELRSPLARMQAAIGIAQQQSEKVPMTLERLEKDAQRMSDLIGELLLLSKMESGEQHQEFQQISLNTLLEEIIEDAHIEAQTKRISIKMDLKQQIIVEVLPSLLHRAIENIIRNAIKYSNEATEVTLTVNESSSMLELHINDQGPGINELELDQVFKPFYRAGQRRENDSVGLGLAIAYRAIKSHGGYIKASNRVVGGLCVTVYLPKTLIVTN